MRGVLAALTVVASVANAAAPAVRVVSDHGIWWFEDAAGKRFFSLGVCCVAGCWGHAEDHPLAPAERERTVARFKAWGFNTAGAWSRPSVWPDAYVMDQIYTGFEFGKNDPFDEAFWNGWIADQVRRETAAFRGVDSFVGYFVDNEPKWDAGDIMKATLAFPAGAPARAALDAFKQAHAAQAPDALAKAWRTEVAKAYYSRYVALVRTCDPGHLILGVRWAGFPDAGLYDALSPLFDVNSVNDYNRYGTLRPEYGRRHAATGKPIMITEWSFSGYPDPGHKSLQFIDVYSQERRAAGYRKYVLEAARAPYMVGMHWFLWSDYEHQDEAKGGYPPDENMGLVTADGATAYEVLTRACARANAEVEAVHRRAVPASPAVRPPEARVLVRLTATVDGDLGEWPAACAATPYVSDALAPGVTPGHRYFLAADGEYLYVGAEVNDAHLDDPGPEWTWEGDALAVYVAGVSVYLSPRGGGKGRADPAIWWWDAAKVPPAARVARRERAGGYVLEARLPWSMLKTGPGRAPFKLDLNYKDVSGIYETWWSGSLSRP